jgi:plastocyanin
MRWLLALVATLVFVPAAYGQGATIQAVDPYSWSPQNVQIQAGESVTWTWVTTHDVKSKGTNWTAAGSASGFTYRFDTPGFYEFICTFHESFGMTGTVTVGNPPPPPPPPLSEQPFANDQAAPTVFEVTDERRPRVTRIRAAGLDGAARVRFRLDEPGRATVRLERGSRGYTRTVMLRRAGARTVTLRGLASGSYRVEVRARDLGGNRSRLKRARVTVR